MISSLISLILFTTKIDNRPMAHKIYEKQIATFTSYSLSNQETDSNPCIAAGNHNLCILTSEEPSKCIAATRLYNLHTKIYVKEIGECEVLDRTSKKYGNRIDILSKTKEEAVNFGKKELEYWIIN